MPEESIYEAALEYARDGLRVFPVEPGGKAPLTAHGFQDATTDAAQLAAWWDATPAANVALDIPLDWVVVDVDPRNGGRETMRALVNEGMAFPPTRVAKTAGGGWHRIYTVEPGQRFRGKLGPGVDIKKGGKGYIVVAPSRTESGVYEWTDERPPVALHATVLRALVRPDKADVADAGKDLPAAVFPFQDGTPYGEAALDRHLGRLIATAEGGRNEALNFAAYSLGQLVAGGELRGEAVTAKLAIAAERMGLEPDEFEGTIRSGLEAGLQEPFSAPEPASRYEDPRATLAAVRDAEDGQDRAFWMDWRIDEPPPAFYMDPVIPRNAYVMVYGATEASKSMVWMYLGAEASRRGLKVSFYSLENPPAVDRDRLRRLRPDPENFRITNEILNLSDPAQVAEFAEREDGRDIIVLDTYSHAFDGGGESQNERAIAFAKTIRLLMKVTGATFVVLDHTGFQNTGEPRDSSAKRQAVDVAVLMEREGAWVKGQAARFRMECKKSARFANPFDIHGKIVDTEGRGLDVEWSPGAGIDWKVP